MHNDSAVMRDRFEALWEIRGSSTNWSQRNARVRRSCIRKRSMRCYTFCTFLNTLVRATCKFFVQGWEILCHVSTDFLFTQDFPWCWSFAMMLGRISAVDNVSPLLWYALINLAVCWLLRMYILLNWGSMMSHIMILSVSQRSMSWMIALYITTIVRIACNNTRIAWIALIITARFHYRNKRK